MGSKPSCNGWQPLHHDCERELRHKQGGVHLLQSRKRSCPSLCCQRRAIPQLGQPSWPGADWIEGDWVELAHNTPRLLVYRCEACYQTPHMAAPSEAFMSLHAELAEKSWKFSSICASSRIGQFCHAPSAPDSVVFLTAGSSGGGRHLLDPRLVLLSNTYDCKRQSCKRNCRPSSRWI